jgi:replicative DNA helicase
MDVKINNLALENAIVSHILKDETFFLKVGEYLRTKDFNRKSYFTDGKLQLIVNLADGFYKKNNKFPTKEDFSVMLGELKEDEEVLYLTKKLVNKIHDEPISTTTEFIEQETLKFIKQNRSIEATLLNKVDIENGNYDNLEARIREAVNVSIDTDLGTSIKDLEANLKLIADSKDEKRSLTTGFPKLDMETGRILPGELFLYAGVSGGGKSLFLMQTALTNFQEGKKIVYFSLEMGYKRLLQRMYQNLFGRKKSEVLTINKELADYLSDEGDLVVKQYPAGIANANMFSAFIRDLMIAKHWDEIDGIFIDYIGIMATNDPKLVKDNSFLYLKICAEEIRNLGYEFNCPVFSASQLNRDALDASSGTKGSLSSKFVSGSTGIVMTVDNFVILIQTAADKKSNKMKLFVDKNRNGGNNTISLNVDYNTLKFSEDNGEKKR